MRDPNRDKAKDIWLQHGGEITNRRIAEILGIDEKKIAVWKGCDKWAVVQREQDNVVQQPDEPVVQRKKIGPPYGSRNALGNRGGPGGPPGNKKAVKTGEHETIWYELLTDDEKRLFGSIDTASTAQADEAIMLLSIRERRMLERIQKLTSGLTESQKKTLQELRTVKEELTVGGKKVVVPREKMVTAEVTETTFRVIEDILRIEEALTRIQAQKLRAIELKNRLNDEEKAVRIEKLQYEVKALRNNTGESKGWTDAIAEVVARRKAMRAGETD